jgi:hypothetical protein
MLSGAKFDWNNPAIAADPYKDRDPRFYATILHEGAQWRPRPSDMVASDPKGIVQVGMYKKADGTDVPGLDTKTRAYRRLERHMDRLLFAEVY